MLCVVERKIVLNVWCVIIYYFKLNYQLYITDLYYTHYNYFFFFSKKNQNANATIIKYCYNVLICLKRALIFFPLLKLKLSYLPRLCRKGLHFRSNNDGHKNEILSHLAPKKGVYKNEMSPHIRSKNDVHKNEILSYL